jgi:hypothetical protein
MEPLDIDVEDRPAAPPDGRARVPCIVVYVALQRYYVRGLIAGALKG